MNIHPTVAAAIFSIFLFMVSFGMTNLFLRIRKLEDSKVESETLRLNIELLDNKIDALKHEAELDREQNQKEHKVIVKTLATISDRLDDIQICLEKIQLQKEC